MAINYDHQRDRITSTSDVLTISTTGALGVPVGNTAQRPTAASGQIRFNTQLQSFEGYNGSGWSSLGGIVDVDQDTKITAESAPGSDEDTLTFTTAGVDRASINNAGLFNIVSELTVGGNVQFSGKLNTHTIPSGTGTIALTSDLYTDSDVDTHLNQSSATIDQVLSWDGTDYSWITNSGAGIILSDISVGVEGTAAGDGGITYDNITGVFTYIPPVLSGITGNTDDITEGTTNLYYTDARVEAVSINEVVEDTTPQLGGDLDLNSKDITGTGNINITGNAVISGYLAGPANFVIDPAGVGDNTGKVVIAGDLQVDGTTTTINSTTLDVDDLNITVAKGAADSAAANGAGLTVDGAAANITYTHATTSWDFNKDIILSGDFLPDGDETRDIGSSTKKWKDLYLSGSTIKLGTGTLNATGTVIGSPGGFDLSVNDTDDLSEGTTNLYYTNARVDAHLNQSNPTAGYVLSWNGSDYAWVADSDTVYTSFNTDFDTRLGTKTTANLTEGTNLYYTNARADARIALQVGANLDLSSKTTSDLSEGTNLYYTNARADARIALQAGANLDLSSKDTDDLSEGSTNLYYTTTRTRAALSASGDISYNSTTGVISYTTPTTDGISEGPNNLYFTDARARGAISVTDSGGDGSLAYNSATGVITYTGPSAAEVRAHVSASGDLTYTQSTGVFSVTTYKSTDFDTDFGNKSTDDLSEGATNLYYTDARADARVDAGFIAKSTTDLSEGTNLYYTNARADARVQNVIVDSDTMTGATATNVPSAESVKAYVDAQIQSIDDLSELSGDTDDITEGTTNLYYTDARVQAVSINEVVEDTTPQLGGDLDLNSKDITGTGNINITGNVTVDGYLAGPANFVIDPAGVGDNTGKVVIAGDLQVDGTTTTINSTTLDVDDLNITVAKGSATAAAANGAGLTVDGASATLTYTNADDRWNLNKDLNVANVYGDVTGNLTGDVTGDVTGNLTGDVTGDITSTGTSTFTSIDVNGGTIDGTAIGSTVTSTGAFTTINGTVITASTNFAGNLTGNVTGDVTGTVSDISNHNTDALSEGSTNLYFTDPRARNAISGGTGVTYTPVTGVIEIGQDVATTSDVTFNDATFDGEVTIEGNLTVKGTTTSVNSNEVNIGDSIILLNSDETSTPSQNGGIEIERGTSDNVRFVWDEVNDRWSAEIYDTNTSAFIGAKLTANEFIGDVTGNVTGQITDISNFTTDDLTEGTTNLYYTDARTLAKINVSSINELSDVDTATTPPTNGQVLVYDGNTTEWVPGTVSGGGGGGNSLFQLLNL